MSQPQNQTDTQALVQSMLQRLKLQPGSESQAYLHTPAAITPVPIDQKVNTSHLNDSGKNGIPSEEFRTSSVDPNDGLDGGEMNGDLISSNAQKHNIDGETGEDMGLSPATMPGTTPTGTGQLLPAKSLTDADTASFERTNGERVSSGNFATTKVVSGDTDAAFSMEQNPDLEQGFTPRICVWSLKSTDTDTGAQENKLLNVGNGGSGAFAPATDNSSFRKKQRPPEKKTKRWTAKLKERWRDRQGSFGKKRKEERGTANHESAKEIEVLAPNQRLTGENPFNNSKNYEEASLSSVDGKGQSESPAHTEDSAADGHIRSTGDFEFGLGSFSLLEEITKGQEWAKFLNANVFSSSANKIPTEGMQVQLKSQADPHSHLGTFNQVNAGINQRSFGKVEPSCVFGGTQVSPDAFLPVSMDVTDPKQTDVRLHTEADQSEPMEDGQNLPDSESKPLSSPVESQTSENVRGLVTRNRLQLTRKRHHQSAERLQPEKMSDGEEADQEVSGQDMEETEGSQLNSTTPNSHPATPSSLNPTFLPPRGVLKHSISRDSQSSMETLSKRRRVEENRHVHFSEEVLVIPAPEPDLDITISEEESEEEEEEEEHSIVEQQLEVEHVVVEEVAPARRPALPNWILALKRKNTGKKPR